MIDNLDVLNGIVYNIIHSTFATKLIPSRLKTAVVTPIYKSGSKNDLLHYGPIATLPFLEKCMEKYISNKLLAYCVSHNIFGGVQYGFLPNSNTEMLLQHLVNDIYRALDSRMCVVLVLLFWSGPKACF